MTGPRGSGKTRWLQLQIHEAAEREPGARCPAVLAEEGRTRMEGFAQRTPGVSVRRILLPCTCCAALADLPGAVRALVASERPNRIFVEVPAVAAAGLLAEFDRELGWQRELTVCLDRSWDMARREHALSPFQAELLERADRVVPNPAGSEPRPDLRAAAGPPLFP
ncbi:MAG TPA: GTP-binding protein [Opitutaceae bacterium]|nr:GTP-binding protein [Opitutaceae bacterium]